MTRLFFVTYAVAGPRGLIGVYKRCVRLIAALHHEPCDVMLLNFGAAPDDPLIRRVVRTVPQPMFRDPHEDPEWMRDSRGRDDLEPVNRRFWKDEFLRLLGLARPDVIVLGECPLAGHMALASSAARRLGVPQICVDNYYGTESVSRFQLLHPFVDRWLLIGLAETHGYGFVGSAAAVVPPLLGRDVNATRNGERGIIVLGYDVAVARLGIDVAQRLGRTRETTSVLSDAVRQALPEIDGVGASVVSPPDDDELRRLLASAAIVVCKNGYQQISEALSFGAVPLCVSVPGGLNWKLLPAYLKRFVVYVGESESISDVDIERLQRAAAANKDIQWAAQADAVAPERIAARMLMSMATQLVGQRH